MSAPIKKENNINLVSWDEFKAKVSDHIKHNLGPRMCRGQSNSNWPLMTSFHRNPNGLTLTQYFQTVEHLADVVGTLENRVIDTRDAEVNGSFLAYLQHHGFPTPLLDWSLSPYIAAYFAFADVIDAKPQSEHISIYVFDFLKWISRWRPIYDYTVTDAHVSVLKPKSLGNRRQLHQQGFYYMWTNVSDIERHVRLLEQSQKETYLEIYRIPASEKFYAITDLEVMGITAFSLFGTTDALCKHYKESIFRKDNEGKGPFERMVEMLKAAEKSDD